MTTPFTTSTPTLKMNNIKICFIYPQTPFSEYVGFPPLSILYLNSYIKQHRYTNTSIVDLNISDNIPSADVYAISSTTPQFPYAKELLHRLNGIKIIGGAHATSSPNDCIQFDKIIIGDGEKALIQCLKDIENNTDRHFYIGEQIENLDTLPMPSRSEIDITKYSYFIDGNLSTIAITSRGCPYNCYFCMRTSKNVRFHSTDYVKKEIEDILKCGYKGIYFQDDIFTLRKDLESLKPELKRISWQCQVRPDENVDTISKLSKMGCKRISIGLESGSQKILDITNKKININNVPNLIRECKKQEINTRIYLVLGLPSESHKTINETIEFLRKVKPDSVGISTFVPYPGTYIYNNIESFDIKINDTDYKKWHFRGKNDGYGKYGYNCIVSTSELSSEDILNYVDKIDTEFNRKHHRNTTGTHNASNQN